MKRRTRPAVLIAISLLIAATTRVPGAEIRAGLAQTDITPPIGGKTTGYRSAPPTDGVHDPLSARVLILKSEQTTVAIVSWDLCIANSPWLHEQVTSLGIDRLLLMNTHTHAGPDFDQKDFPSPDEPWRQTIEKRVLEAIRTAQGKLFPAFFAAGSGSIKLGYNRLVRQPEGHAITHFENPERIPYGPVDPTVGVIRQTDESGATRAVLVAYACHPVVLGPRNAKISADYPGVLRNLVEEHVGKEHVGKEAMCIFIQGCAGDINPLAMARSDTREDDFAVVERTGELLADEVIRVLGRMQTTKGSSEQLVSSSSLITVANRWNSDETVPLGVTSLLLNGEIGVVTLPGEPFHKFQVDLRERAGLPHAFVFGYCSNGPYRWPAYLPDICSAARGGYGASDTTRAEVGAGERLLDRGLVQLYTLRGRLKAKAQRHTHE